MKIHYYYSISLLILIFGVIHAFEAVLEKIDLGTINDNYVRNVTAFVSKISRRHTPVLNIYCTAVQTWDNNVTVRFIYEEYLYSKYRSAFVGLRYKLCDFLTSPLLNIRLNYGIECPVPPGEYQLTNMSVQWNTVPNMFPFKKGRVAFEFSAGSAKEIMMDGYLYVGFK